MKLSKESLKMLMLSVCGDPPNAYSTLTHFTVFKDAIVQKYNSAKVSAAYSALTAKQKENTLLGNIVGNSTGQLGNTVGNSTR